MKTVGAFDAKTHLSELLADVSEKHEEVIIQKRGKDVAALIPVESLEHHRHPYRAQHVLEGLKEIRDAAATYGTDKDTVKDLVNDGRKR